MISESDSQLSGKKYPQAKIVEIDLAANEYDQVIDLRYDWQDEFVQGFYGLDKESRNGWQYINLPISQLADPNTNIEFTLGKVIQLEANDARAFVVTLMESFYFQLTEDDEVIRRFNWAKGDDNKEWERLRNARPLATMNSPNFNAIVCSHTKQAGGMESQVIIKVDNQFVDDSISKYCS